MEQNLPAVGAPVEPTVKPLPPERAAFVEWLRAYAGGGEHWRGNVLMGEHDIALALWKDRQSEIDRLQAKFAALRMRTSAWRQRARATVATATMP